MTPCSFKPRQDENQSAPVASTSSILVSPPNVKTDTDYTPVPTSYYYTSHGDMALTAETTKLHFSSTIVVVLKEGVLVDTLIDSLLPVCLEPIVVLPWSHGKRTFWNSQE